MTIDGSSYEKTTAPVALEKEKVPTLEQQIQLAKAQEAAAKKIADGVLQSRKIGRFSNEELIKSRNDAPAILEGAFDDFSTPAPTEQNNTRSAPSIPDSPAQRTTVTQSGVSRESYTPAPITIRETAPTEEVVLGGTLETTRTKEAKEAQEQIQAGKTSPDNFQKVMDGVKGGFESLPKGLQDFFKGILNFMKGLAGIENDNNAISGSMISPDSKAILDKYAKSNPTLDGKTNIAFNPGAAITMSKKEKPPTNVPKAPNTTGNTTLDTTATPTDASKQTISKKIDGNSVVLDKYAKIKTVQESTGTITLVAENKDGSIDTYTIVNTQEKSAVAAPEGVPAQSA